MSYLKTYLWLGILALIIAPGAGAAESDSAHPYLTEKFFADIGVYFPDRRLRISVDGTDGSEREDIDFGNELGMKNSDETAALNFGWRIAKHWRFTSQYFRSSDDLLATLDEEIEWGDDVFPVGGEVTAGQSLTLVRMLIGYEFNDADKQAFGFGGGHHWLDIGSYIEGDLLVGGPGGQPVADRRAVDAAGLLPNIGAWYRYSMTDKWVLTARYDWLGAEIGDYDGRLVNASAGINYQVFEHFGIGVNYNFFELDVKISKPDWVGKVATSYDGLYVYLSAYW